MKLVTDVRQEEDKLVTTVCYALIRYIGEGLLVEIVVRSETWVNRYEPNSQSKSMRWRQTISPRRRLKKSKLSDGKNRGYSFLEGVRRALFL